MNIEEALRIVAETDFYYFREDGTAVTETDRCVDVWCNVCGKGQAVVMRAGFPVVDNLRTSKLSCNGDRRSHQDSDEFELLTVMLPPTTEQLQ